MRSSQRGLSTIAVLLMLAAAAITPLAARAQGYRVGLPAYAGSVLMDTLRQDHDFKAGPDLVYAATLAVFAKLGIPITDTSSGAVIANTKLSVTHFFAGSITSQMYGCGEVATGPTADAWRLQMAIAAFVLPKDGGGTRLGIATAASASDPTGLSRDPKTCVSTGLLETKIYNGVAKLVR
jgi:hypothetical protein